MLNLAILGPSDFENWNSKESLGMGGATGVIKSILPYLNADKVYLMGITSDKKKLYSEIPYKNNITIIPIVYVPKKTIIPVRIYLIFYSRMINSILKKYNIHSVYSHAEEMSFWIKPGLTVLYHMHGSANALVKAKNKLFRIKLLQYLWELVRRRNIRNATKIIAIDNLCYDLTKRQKAERKTILMPNFVDTSVFYPDSTPCKQLEHIMGEILLFVGRIEEVKGLELFVDTLLELNKKDPDKWRGVFVGSGSYQTVIQKYIIDKSANELFCFTGPVFEQNEMRKIYNRASVLMISSHYEGIPMVIMESMACGTSVVSTDVGGIKEFIADNNMCFVNNRRDPEEFAELIKTIKVKKNIILPEIKFSSSSAGLLINKILHKYEDGIK